MIHLHELNLFELDRAFNLQPYHLPKRVIR